VLLWQYTQQPGGNWTAGYPIREQEPQIMTTYENIRQIEYANTSAGHYFFSPSTMRFFRSKIASRSIIGGRYFITSEQFDASSPRLYTIRIANDDGSIDTVGEFQQYETVEAAKRAAKQLAA
jgi:hypothetical protein